MNHPCPPVGAAILMPMHRLVLCPIPRHKPRQGPVWHLPSHSQQPGVSTPWIPRGYCRGRRSDNRHAADHVQEPVDGSVAPCPPRGLSKRVRWRKTVVCAVARDAAGTACRPECSLRVILRHEESLFIKESQHQAVSIPAPGRFYQRVEVFVPEPLFMYVCAGRIVITCPCVVTRRFHLVADFRFVWFPFVVSSVSHISPYTRSLYS